MEKTFFDYIGVSDMERIHSATIGWMISDDCKALTIGERTPLLNTLFKTERTDISSIEVINELEHIDVAFITTSKNNNKELWVLENKVKAPLAGNQLRQYSDVFEGIVESCTSKVKNITEKHYTVLSLMGVLPQDKDKLGKWKLVKYEELFNVIDSICSDKVKHNDNHLAIIQEYRNCISNLVKALSEFRKNPQSYPNVFTDGSKTKNSKPMVYSSVIGEYIATNSLETLFQKVYFTEIVDDIYKCCKGLFESCHVGESHGNADMGFHFGSLENEDEYKFDLAFQNGAFKLAVCDKDYSPLKKKSSKWYKFMDKWEKPFKKVAQKIEYNDYKRFNKPRGRTRLSISYNIGTDWYMENRNSFTERVISEINRARKMLKEIIIESQNEKLSESNFPE